MYHYNPQITPSSSLSMDPPYKPTLTPELGEITLDDCIFTTYRWKVPNAQSNPRPMILLVHGYRDHHAAYSELAETLVKKLNVDVFFFYQRGEGTTRLVNGRRGVTNDAHAYAAIDAMIAKAASDPTVTEIHLLGHSMGGGLVLNYACGCGGRERNGNNESSYHINSVKSIVACAPLIELHPHTHPGQLIEWVVRAVCALPWTKTLRVKSPLDVEAITGDPQWQDWMRASIDPKTLNGAFVETRDFILRGRALLSDQVIQCIARNLPILVCHGDADKINDVRASREWVGKASNVENAVVSMKEYKDGRHSLMVDAKPVREAFLHDVTEFYRQQIAK